MKNYIVQANERDLFNSLFNDFFKPDTYYREGIMATDAIRNEKGLQLEIEMPGFAKDEIELSYEKGYLYVSAKKAEKEEDKEDKKSYSLRERNVSMRRSYYVGEINEEGITAKYDAGVLTVTLPNQEKVETSKKIAIE